MKQIERRMHTGIVIECELTLREKLRVLLSKKFAISVDLLVDSENGVLESECSEMLSQFFRELREKKKRLTNGES